PPARVVDALQTAIDAGVISLTPPTTLPVQFPTPIGLDQTARRLDALGNANGDGPMCDPTKVGNAVVTGWLAANGDIAPFWASVLAFSPGGALQNPTLAKAHLELVVCALIEEGDPSKLLGALQAESISVASVRDLDPTAFGGNGGITYAHW